MRLAVDTHLLVYAEGIGDARRCRPAQALALRLLRARLGVAGAHPVLAAAFA